MRCSLLALLVVVATARAGIYSPDDPCPFSVAADGVAQPLPHNLFVARVVDRLAPRVPNTPDPPGIPDWFHDGDTAQATYAARLGQQLAARWPKAPQLRGDDLLAHTAALLRFNATDQAVNLLDRGRVGRNYFLKMNRTHAFATSRQWADALTNLPDEPEEPPQALSGTTAEQFRWQRGIDHGAYQRWLELRDTEFKKWKNQADTHPDATPFALFTTGHGEEIRYWESAEQARLLPSDAIAVVQELLLRSPWDDRLLWSLAEVYFAQGKVRESHSAYEMLASDRGRQFRGPRLLTPMVQRVGVEFAKLPAEESAVLQLPDEAASPADGGLLFGLVDPLSFYTAAGLFFLAVLLMAFLQWRAIQRRTGVLGRRR